MMYALLKTARGVMTSRIVGFAADRRAAAAVEFAALLPFMLLLYIGGVEISQGVSADRKVTLTARTVADLASRVTTIDDPSMTGVLNASSAVLAPYSVTNLTMTVSQVYIDNTGHPTIRWSDSLNGTPRAKGSAVTIPAGLVVNDSYLIWGEAQYNYTPTLGYVMTSTLVLRDAIFMAPRMSLCVRRGTTTSNAVC
jgi:Flp pilus assembly protein TadG